MQLEKAPTSGTSRNTRFAIYSSRFLARNLRLREGAMCRVWEYMTGNLFTCEISGQIRVSAHVPPTGRFPNCLVSRLTVCLRDERRVARNFRTHDHRWRNTLLVYGSRQWGCALKTIVRRSVVLFLYCPTLTTTSKLNGAMSLSGEMSEKYIYGISGDLDVIYFINAGISKVIPIAFSLPIKYYLYFHELLIYIENKEHVD